nr:EAL domain-containing protein [Sphingomonas baiyangensis]
MGAGAERTLQQLRFAARDMAASGDLVIVEIDAASLARIGRWPIPRENHAAVIDRLRAANAAMIAFDVDFSAQSSASGDAALASALARAGDEVVLPTLAQSAGSGGGVIDLLPAPAFRPHAALAAVSVLPDGDGYVRSAPLGIVTAGVPRPSLSAMVASAAGSVGESFAIDYAIHPATIPRLSFLDIRDGRFDRAAVAGRRVLIGATAVEMGDRYAVPRFGVVPGVVIQALAAETLMRGTPVSAGWWPLWLLALPLGGAILWLGRRASIAAIALAPVVLTGAALFAEQYWATGLALVPGLIVLTGASAVAIATRVAEGLQARRAADAATGLPNRVALRATGTRAGGVTIAAVRIAGFDRLGAGLRTEQLAQLVCRVADRVALVAAGATVYRIEDRLLVWESDVALDWLADRFEALRVAMLRPVEVDGRRVDVTLALGAAIDPAGDPDRAAANAVLAADAAEEAGDPWRFHAGSVEAEVERELSLLGELDEAVAAGELEVLFQPKLDLRADRIVSVEALVRWRHRERGPLSPDLFIPLAEKGGRIDGLTFYVFDRTIEALHRWAAAGHPIVAAINLSARLVTAPDFMAALADRIAASGVAPEALILEVTESAAMHDPAGAAAALAAIRALGVRISMDDYGTGQSTLSYLKRLPLDELKIDRSFVQHAHSDRGDAVLVRSTIDMAHELGLKVVAEGVEDEACLAWLRAAGCDLAQGYHISRPTSAGAVLELLDQQQRAAAA